MRRLLHVGKRLRTAQSMAASLSPGGSAEPVHSRQHSMQRPHPAPWMNKQLEASARHIHAEAFVCRKAAAARNARCAQGTAALLSWGGYAGRLPVLGISMSRSLPSCGHGTASGGFHKHAPWMNGQIEASARHIHAEACFHRDGRLFFLPAYHPASLPSGRPAPGTAGWSAARNPSSSAPASLCPDSPSGPGGA